MGWYKAVDRVATLLVNKDRNYVAVFSIYTVEHHSKARNGRIQKC